MNFIVNTDLAVNKNLLRTDFIKNWKDIVVAGGHVIAAIKDNEEASLKGDIDIFFVSRKFSKDKAIQKIKHIYKWLSDYHDQKPKINLKLDTVTFICRDNSRVQVIVSKVFDSITELLTSFDLDCCRFAYDGKTIHTVKGGHNFLLTNNVTVFCPENVDMISVLEKSQYSPKSIHFSGDVTDRCKMVRLGSRLGKYYKRYNIQINVTTTRPKGLFQFDYDNEIDSDISKEYAYPGKDITYKKYLELLNSDKLIQF